LSQFEKDTKEVFTAPEDREALANLISARA
jgi:hypothetical protein